MGKLPALLLAACALAGCRTVERGYRPSFFAPAEPVFFLRSALGDTSQDVLTQDGLGEIGNGDDKAFEWPGADSPAWKGAEKRADEIVSELRKAADDARLPMAAARLAELERATGIEGREKVARARAILNETSPEIRAALADIRSRRPQLPRFEWRNERAADFFLDANNAVDAVAFEDEGYGFVANVWPGAMELKPRVTRLLARVRPGSEPFNSRGSNGFHFDDLFTFDAVAKRWAALEDWMRFQAEECAKDWSGAGRDDFICALGIAVHATQDFYQHSNWVEILRRVRDVSDADAYPLWGDVMPSGDITAADLERLDAIRRLAVLLGGRGKGFDRGRILEQMRRSNVHVSGEREEGGLQTGSWNHDHTTQPGTGNAVAPWGHDHPNMLTRTRRVVNRATEREVARTVTMMMGFLEEKLRADLIAHLSRSR